MVILRSRAAEMGKRQRTCARVSRSSISTSTKLTCAWALHAIRPGSTSEARSEQRAAQSSGGDANGVAYRTRRVRQRVAAARQDDVVAPDHAAGEEERSEEEVAPAHHVEIAERRELTRRKDARTQLPREAHEARGLEAPQEPRAVDPRLVDVEDELGL